MSKRGKRQTVVKKTTVWDFLIVLGSGIVNLLKAEKIACIVALYLLFRDIYFLFNFDKGIEYQERLIDANDIIELLSTGNTLVIVLACIVVCLVFVIIILICNIKFVYGREIQRLAEERSRMMHDIANGSFTPLEKHNSSLEKCWEGML